MTGTTMNIRVKKVFLKDIFEPLRKILARKKMVEEKDITYPEISLELRQRIINSGGIKEI